MNTIKQKDIQEKKSKVFISFVLDESGSMSVGQHATVNGINEQIQTLKNKFKDTPAEVIVSFVKFSDNIISLYEGKTLDNLQELESHAYKPNGSTALFDATGYCIDMMNRMDGINDETSSALLVIITDGQENASRHFNASQIAEKIKALTETKRWTVTYLGPDNVDLSKVKQSISTSYGNMFRGSLTSEVGYQDALEVHTKGLRSWANNISYAVCSGVSFATQDFYGTTGAGGVGNQTIKAPDLNGNIQNIVPGKGTDLGKAMGIGNVEVVPTPVTSTTSNTIDNTQN